jgi:hypothetical protein
VTEKPDFAKKHAAESPENPEPITITFFANFPEINRLPAKDPGMEVNNFFPTPATLSDNTPSGEAAG